MTKYIIHGEIEMTENRANQLSEQFPTLEIIPVVETLTDDDMEEWADDQEPDDGCTCLPNSTEACPACLRYIRDNWDEGVANEY